MAELNALPGVQLHVVTSRHAEIEDATRTWLERHFPGIFPEDRIHIGNHWGSKMLKKSVSKPDLCAGIGAKVLVDDSPVYVQEAIALQFNAVLFDWQGSYGWNQERIEDN